MKELTYAAAWMKTGSICGLLSMLVYFAAAFIPMPPVLSYATAFAIGPLLAIGCAGLFYFLIHDDYSPRVMIAMVSGVAASIFLLLMLTVQQSSFAIMDKSADADAGVEIKAGQKYITDGLNSVHFGMDIAWDVLISIATILFGYSLTKKNLYWKILGIVGSILGLLLLSFNIYHFPNPPESVQSVDWGPFVAIWYILLFSSVVSVFVRKKKQK
jgi:hypothetical protein